MKKFLKKLIKFFLCLIVFLLVIAAVLYFTRNIIATAVLEKAGSAANGAKVDIHDLNLDLFKQRISIERVEVTDRKATFKNILDTGLVLFDFQLMPLLDKKVIIDSMSVENIKTGTKRKSDGKIERSQNKIEDSKPSWIKEFAVKRLENEKKNIPVLNPEFFKDSIDVDKIAEELKLITPLKVKEAKTYLDSRKAFWKDHFERMDYEKRVEDIRKIGKSIKVNDHISPIEAAEEIKKVKSLLDDVEKLKKDVEKDRSLAKADIEKINEYKRALPQWIKEDYEKTRQKISFEKNNLKNIGEMLFGRRLTSIFIKAFDLLDRVRSAGEKTVKKEDDKKAAKNEKYPFLPSLWIKETAVSGQLQDISLKGEILNITNDQNKTGKPISILVSGNEKGKGKLNLNGAMDFRKGRKDINADIDFKELVLNDFKVSSSELFPVVIKKGRGSIKTKIFSTEDLLRSDISIKAEDLVFDQGSLKSAEGKLSSIVKSVTDSVSHIKIDAKSEYGKNGSDISIKSNLDSIFADEISKALEKEVKRAREKLEKIVSAKLENEEKTFISKSGNDEGFILEKLGNTDSSLKSGEQNIKEMKKKLEQKLKKSGESLLKNFKFKL